MERSGGRENLWDERAQAYRDSAPHASGPDLDLLVAWAGQGEGRTALDVGSGGGHSFDLVASRLASHHFAGAELALSEMARVTRELVLLEDLLFVDERVEEAEKLRDASHVRAYSLDQWHELFTVAGLEIEATEVIERQSSFSAWLERCGCKGDRAEKARELVSHRLDGDSYTSTVFLIEGVKAR